MKKQTSTTVTVYQCSCGVVDAPAVVKSTGYHCPGCNKLVRPPDSK